MATSLRCLPDSLLKRCASSSRISSGSASTKAVFRTFNSTHTTQLSRPSISLGSCRWTSISTKSPITSTIPYPKSGYSTLIGNGTAHARFYSTRRSYDDSTAGMGERASKTHSRFSKNKKKRKDAAGRAFKDVQGYGDMLHGLDAGLNTARAMRKAKKMQPKPFTGKVAMYFANTSTAPDPVITEENLESMPKPNTIRTVKAVRVDRNVIGSESTDALVDYISEKKKTMTPAAIQRDVERLTLTGQALPTLQRKGDINNNKSLDEFFGEIVPQSEDDETAVGQLEKANALEKTRAFKQQASVISEEEAEEVGETVDSELVAEEEDDNDVWYGDEEEGEMDGIGGDADYAPKRLSPDDNSDLDELTPATRQAMLKVRSLFQGSLSFYQPPDGELALYVAMQQEKKKSISSQRAALTSANAVSVRNILSNTKTQDSVVGLSEQERKAIVGEKQKVPKSAKHVQPKAFFDYSQIQTLASREWSKSKRAGKELNTPLKEVAGLPQICVVGRSNVGKSSLLNCIMGPKFKSLRVSKTPGRTQNVQMLVVNEKFVVADTPGYGYAAATPKARKEMEHRIGEYLTSRLPRRVYMLIDARRGLGNADIRLADSLEQLHIVYQLVLTKIDKKQSREQEALIERNLQQWVSRRGCAMNDIIKTSSKDRSGIDQFRLSIFLACGFKL